MSKPLYQPMSGVLTVQYEPNEQTVFIENPPRFTWIPAQLENDRYILQYSLSEQFDTSDTVTIPSVSYNLYTPNHLFEAGTYQWRYALLTDEEGGQTEWSTIRSFTVGAGLPETPLPAGEERYTGLSSEHPRLWLKAKELPEFRRKVEHVPYLDRYVRELYFVKESFIVVVDQVDLSQSGSVDWLFHTLYEMKRGRSIVQSSGTKSRYGRPLRLQLFRRLEAVAA
jgi:hypothetical protein